jgi:hypothetical protein
MSSGTPHPIARASKPWRRPLVARHSTGGMPTAPFIAVTCRQAAIRDQAKNRSS